MSECIVEGVRERNELQVVCSSSDSNSSRSSGRSGAKIQPLEIGVQERKAGTLNLGGRLIGRGRGPLDGRPNSE